MRFIEIEPNRYLNLDHIVTAEIEDGELSLELSNGEKLDVEGSVAKSIFEIVKGKE